MNSEIVFEKWQACGNDFILTEINSIDEVKICDRHYGIGADGVIYILPSEIADSKIRIINSDGTEAEMCGNGIRCVGRYLAKKLKKNSLTVETLAGIKSLIVSENKVRVEMGFAVIKWQREIKLAEKNYNAIHVDIGNPHCILFVNSVKAGEVEQNGKLIENMSNLFPNKTNVEFVTIESRNKVRVRVWERGCGRTLACGTGACSSAFAAYKQGLTDSNVEVELDGGTVQIEITDSGIIMTGPAEYVYSGVI